MFCFAGEEVEVNVFIDICVKFASGLVLSLFMLAAALIGLGIATLAIWLYERYLE